MALHKNPNLDSVTTINKDGSHFKLHPSDVKGKYTFWRRVVGYTLLILYAALPWIQINGHPALFFDTDKGWFHVFGLSFITQDLWLIFFLISGLGFTLFFVTSLLGRIWCGWTCPYTLFLDHLYRRIERLIEGDAPARRKLDQAPMDGVKLVKRITKHTLYILLSLLIALIFSSYFISVKQLLENLQHPIDNISSFSVVIFLTVVLYFCFAWFREQFCIVMCPYGRIQSALSDDDTMVIGYDANRGEPRGKPNDPNAGDCIDCRRCVQVCPTGIDIRNGLQMECIGCAACVDACNAIMTKLHRPKGLVRYDSFNGLTQKKRRILRPRILAYLGLMLLGAATFSLTLYKKARPFSAQVNKMPGTSYQQGATGVRNIYQIHLVNKRNAEAVFDITLPDAPEGTLTTGTVTGITLPPETEKTYTLVVLSPADKYQGKFEFTIQVKSRNDGSTIERKVRFLGPGARRYRKMLEKMQSTPATSQ